METPGHSSRARALRCPVGMVNCTAGELKCGMSARKVRCTILCPKFTVVLSGTALDNDQRTRPDAALERWQAQNRVLEVLQKKKKHRPVTNSCLLSATILQAASTYTPKIV